MIIVQKLKGNQKHCGQQDKETKVNWITFDMNLNIITGHIRANKRD